MNNSTLVENEVYKSICRISFLCYYSALSMYAVINLYTLFFGVLNLPSGTSILLAIGAILFAMVNELINMQMITNPQATKQVNNNQKSRIKNVIIPFSIVSILCLAMIDVYTNINNMTLIQQNTLTKIDAKMPVIAVTIYNTYFMVAGLTAQSMAYLTNLVHYTYGSSAKREKIYKKTEKKDQTQIKKWLGEYIKNPVLMSSGVSIGAFLYAYSDFQVFLGLMLMLTQLQMMQISTTNLLLMAVFFATCTFFERILLWGHNFRRFEKENNGAFGAQDYFFHKIPKSDWARKSLTTLRIALLGIRGIMNAFVCFIGWKKYLGFLSTVSYITTSYVQSSLQVRPIMTGEQVDKKGNGNRQNSIETEARIKGTHSAVK